MWLSTVVTKRTATHSINQINLELSVRLMKIAIKIHLFLLGLVLSASSAIVSAQTVTVIKFSHVAASDTPKGKAALRFKELVEQATGRLRVDVYANNHLYKEADELEALQLGAVQMVAPSLAKLARYGTYDFEVFDLPYLFADQNAVERVTEGPVGRTLLRKLESKGMVGLAYWDQGFKIMSANKALNMPVDFVGQKMRIYSSPVLKAQMGALGAIPQMLDESDVYFALRSGVVTGTESTPANFYSKKLYEVQRHVTVSNHGYVGSAVIVNKKFWDSLPSELRKVVDDAMRQATSYGNALAAKENEEALALIKKTRKTIVHVLTKQESAAWQQALLPVQDELKTRVGGAIVTAVNYAAEGRRVGTR